MDRITLQHILLPTEERFESCPGLFFRRGAFVLPYPNQLSERELEGYQPSQALPASAVLDDAVRLDAAAGALHLSAGQAVSLCTYFNTLSINKWKRLTGARDFCAHLDLQGTGEVVLMELQAADVEGSNPVLHSCKAHEIARLPFDFKTRATLDVPLGCTGATAVGFDVVAHGDAAFFGGSYSALPAQLHQTDICILSTTFQKEEFILGNLSMLREQVWEAGSNSGSANPTHDASMAELAQHLDIIVVDNGQTLDAAAVEGAHVRLFPNRNAGGAGGFARGMIEAMRSERAYSHVLIMDDDLSMHTEAFWRTYRLLSMLLPRHRGKFVSGAMLRLNETNIQHEDIGIVHEVGFYAPRKGVRDLYDPRCFVINDANWETKPNTYAAWWYCCIPFEYVRPDNLPMPLFVRGDDVEYSLRNKPGFITLNGICVWHMGFNKKYSASMECYQVMRNSLILQAASQTASRARYFRLASDTVLYSLYQFAYDYADLVLDAMEDYLRGPAILEDVEPTQTMREKGAKNEVLRPLEEFRGLDIALDFDDPESWELVRKDDHASLLTRALRMATINGHRPAPAFFYRSGVATCPYDWDITGGKISGHSQVLAVNPEEGTAILRTKDMERFEQIMERKKRVEADYRAHNAQVEQAWQERYPYLTSIEFWTRYLGIS